MSGLRIGINALYLIPGAVGGTEIYLRNLVPALRRAAPENDYILFTNRETGNDLGPARVQPVAARHRPWRIVWEQTGLPVAAARERLDVLFNPGFTAPLLCPCPMVTVFHDMQHKRHPEHFRRLDLLFWRLLLYGSAHRSQGLIAVSEATRDDVLRYYRLPAAKVSVVPHGVEERFFEIGRQRQPDPARPYLLCVSTLHPHKNLERLVRAFAVFRARHPDFRLVLAGLHGFHFDAVTRLIAELDLGESVETPGWIPREELYDLYRRATASVFPSTFEGFGMPVVEALAAGLPTACSAIPPLVEVAGEAALLFDPASDQALVDALLRLVEDAPLVSRLTAAGPARAAAYTWERSARLTLAALRAAATGSG